jgi:toxin YoeB
VAKFAIQTTKQFDEDYQYWQETDAKIVAKINRLLAETELDPFRGTGRPEPMRYDEFRNCWSRRITREHRLVYHVDKGVITFQQCRYHY